MKQLDSLMTGEKFKNTEIGEIPVDWEVVKLDDIARITMGQSPPSKNCRDYKNGLPFFQGKAEFGIKYPKIIKWCNSPKKTANEGDILISVRAPVGDINIAPEKCCIGRGLAAVQGIQSHNDFLYFMINHHRHFLLKIGQGNTFNAINKDVLLGFRIPYPPVTEQKKISKILSAIDEAIEKKIQIIEKTKELKKGLMQELFTKGIGHSEFKKTEIGEIPVDWEIKTLINAVGINNNLIVAGPFGYNLKVEDYRDTGIPIIRLQNIEYCKFINKDIKYISIKKADELKYHSFKKGDIILAKLGDPIGETCIIPESMEKGIVVADVVRIRIDEQFSVKKYIMYILNSFYGTRQLNREIIGTTRPRVNLNQVRNIVIPYPPLAEQKKIAVILSSVDSEIENEIANKEKLIQIKNGLMQVLLTGKIRVKV